MEEKIRRKYYKRPAVRATKMLSMLVCIKISESKFTYNKEKHNHVMVQ